MDIYFEEKYGKLCEKAEKGETVCIDFNCEYGKVRYLFIKRRIPTNNEKKLFDIITPYGYGGPIILETTNKEKLVELFKIHMEQYYKENNIVSEFVRFHPIKQNAEDFTTIYNIEHIRNTLFTRLNQDEDFFETQFSKNSRKKVRQALNRGISYELCENVETLDRFKELYYASMDRNSATDFYYFDDEYFDFILSEFKEQILLINAKYEEKVIAAMLCFISDETLYIHLSGTMSDYMHLCPTYVLKYAAMTWGKEHAIKQVYHGGGRTNSEDDSLYAFKRQFTKDGILQFFIAKKICDEQMYSELCKETANANNSEFFPAYRMR